MKLLKVKIASLEIAGIILIGNVWAPAMSNADNRQSSDKVSFFFSGGSQIFLAVKRHVHFHLSADTPNAEIQHGVLQSWP